MEGDTTDYASWEVPVEQEIEYVGKGVSARRLSRPCFLGSASVPGRNFLELSEVVSAGRFDEVQNFDLTFSEHLANSCSPPINTKYQ